MSYLIEALQDDNLLEHIEQYVTVVLGQLTFSFFGSVL